MFWPSFSTWEVLWPLSSCHHRWTLPSDQPSSRQPVHCGHSSSVRSSCRAVNFQIRRWISMGSQLTASVRNSIIPRGHAYSSLGNSSHAAACLLLFILSLLWFHQYPLAGVRYQPLCHQVFLYLNGRSASYCFGVTHFIIPAALSRRSFVLLCLSHTHHCVLKFSHHFVIRYLSKPWSTGWCLDVFLVSGHPCFRKPQDYSGYFVGPYLIGLILPAIQRSIGKPHSVRRYWEAWLKNRLLLQKSKNVHFATTVIYLSLKATLVC